MSRVFEVLLPGLLSQPVQLLEVVLALGVWLVLRLRPRWLTPPAIAWRHAAQRPAACMTGLAFCLVALHVTLEWRQPRRAPAVHDEFGYLLAAETLLEGRLTNPTPPEWRALDTVHVNFVPSYNAMYPPGQAVALAASWRLLGHPVYANWILAPLVGWTTWWMLAGWMPRRWALLGGTLVMLRLGLFGYWAETYMTGALPAVCAQLFAGALPRVVRRPSPVVAACGAVALAVMFSSRPFEAVVLGACAVPMVWLLRPAAGRAAIARAAVPALVLFALVIAAVAYSNHALTGHPFRFGYDLNMERHGYGVFAGARTAGVDPPVTAHMAAFYDETRRYAAYGWTVGGFVGTRLRTLGWVWVFLIGPFLTLGWRGWRRSLAVGRLRPALPGLVGFFIVVAAHPWSFPHYYAGALGFLVLFALTGLRVWCMRRRLPVSRVAGTIAAAAGLVLAVRTIAGGAVLHAPLIPIEWLPYHTPRGFEARRAFEAEAGRDGPALVFVRYGSDEPLRRDWVYNAPSPQDARVVWVNDRGPADNARTARAYAGRRWICVAIEGERPRPVPCATWVAATPVD
jgi:hypothetical protein